MSAGWLESLGAIRYVRSAAPSLTAVWPSSHYPENEPYLLVTLFVFNLGEWLISLNGPLGQQALPLL